MKYLLHITILYFIFCCQSLSAQSYINVQGGINYWQHTDLMGASIGLGYSYNFGKFSLRFNYDFGYGWKDRIKEMDNIDYDHWSTVFVKTKKSQWSYFHPNHSKSELQGKSDYAKQNQMSVHLDFPLFQENGVEYNIAIGSYAAIVEHFFTLKNILVHHVDLYPYHGPLNYIPTSSRRILTYGIDAQLFLNIRQGTKIWSPFISGGYGPGYGSYANIGLRLSTQLKKMKR